MKITYLFIIFFLSMCFQPFAQSSKQIIRHPSEYLTRELIKNMYLFSEAWAKSDTVTLSKMLAPQYQHSDVTGALQHRNDWLIFAANKRVVSDLKIYNTEVLLYHDDVAVITGEISYLWGIDKLEQELRFTQIWTKNKSEWKRSAFQGTYITKAK